MLFALTHPAAMAAMVPGSSIWTWSCCSGLRLHIQKCAISDLIEDIPSSPPQKKKETNEKQSETYTKIHVPQLAVTSNVWFLQQKASWHEPFPSQTMPFLTQANGGHLAPQLTLQPSPLGGQGLFVEEGIESQTTILELPLEACLHLGANVLVYNSHCLFHPSSSTFPFFPIWLENIHTKKKTPIETRNI